MSGSGLPARPDFLPRQIDPRLRNTHLEPAGPKPPGKRPPPSTGPLSIPVHSREGHRLRSLHRRPQIEFLQQKRAAEKQAERERILYGTKPTLEQRLAAIPPPTYTPITPKPVLLDFKKLSTADLIRIFDPKFTATLRRLNVFETFEFTEHVAESDVQKLRKLIDRLTHLQRSLKDTGSTRVQEEFQGWNYGFKQIGDISFKGLRKNQTQIIKALSAVWNGNFFGYE